MNNNLFKEREKVMKQGYNNANKNVMHAINEGKNMLAVIASRCK